MIELDQLCQIPDAFCVQVLSVLSFLRVRYPSLCLALGVYFGVVLECPLFFHEVVVYSVLIATGKACSMRRGGSQASSFVYLNLCRSLLKTCSVAQEYQLKMLGPELPTIFFFISLA